MLKSIFDRYLPSESTHCKFQNFPQEAIGTNKTGLFNVGNNLYDLHCLNNSSCTTTTTRVSKPIDCKPQLFRSRNISVHLQVPSNTTMNCFWRSSESIVDKRPMSLLPFISQIFCSSDLVSGLSRSAPGALERKPDLGCKDKQANMAKKSLYENIERTINSMSILTSKNTKVATSDAIPACKVALKQDIQNSSVVKKCNDRTTEKENNKIPCQHAIAVGLSNNQTQQKTILNPVNFCDNVIPKENLPNVCQNPLIAYIIGCNEDSAHDDDSDWSEWDEDDSDWTADELSCTSADVGSVTSDYSSTDSTLSDCHQRENVSDELVEHDFGECAIKLERPRCNNSFISFILNLSDGEDDNLPENEMNSADFGRECESDALWEEFGQTEDPYALIGGKAFKNCKTEYQKNMCNNFSNNSSTKKVHFNDKVEVHHMFAWSFAYRDARKGQWETCARDTNRFQMRINSLEQTLSKVLDPKHRDFIYNTFVVRNNLIPS